jgi:hypothetical protein
VTGSYEHGNKTSGSIKGEEFPGPDLRISYVSYSLGPNNMRGLKKCISRFTVLTYRFTRTHGIVLKLIAAVRMIFTSGN